MIEYTDQELRMLINATNGDMATQPEMYEALTALRDKLIATLRERAVHRKADR